MGQQQVRKLISHALSKDPQGVRDLLELNGVNTSRLGQAGLTIAFLKAIKDSPSFRQNFADYVRAKAGGNVSFVSQPAYMNMLPLEDVDNMEQVTNEPTTTTTTVTETKKTGFFPSLGSAITNNLDKILGTGLETLSAKLKADANKSSEENALELERLKLAQIQAAGENELNKPPTNWGKIALIGGGVLLVGGIIYLIAKKK